MRSSTKKSIPNDVKRTDAWNNNVFQRKCVDEEDRGFIDLQSFDLSVDTELVL